MDMSGYDRECPHDDGFYTQSKTVFTNHYNSDGDTPHPDFTDYTESTGGGQAYCVHCNINMGHAANLIVLIDLLPRT